MEKSNEILVDISEEDDFSIVSSEDLSLELDSMIQKVYLDQEIYLSNKNECMTAYYAGYKKALEDLLFTKLDDMKFSFRDRVIDFSTEYNPNEKLLEVDKQ